MAVSYDIVVEDVDLHSNPAAFQDELQDLMQRSAEANPVYGADMIYPALSALTDDTKHLRALCLWAKAPDQAGQKLVGFFPYQERRLLAGFGPKITAAWHHQYGFNTIPLFDADYALQAIQAWLDWIARSGKLIRLPVAVRCPLMVQIENECAASSMSFARQELYQRAVMRPDPAQPGYLARVMSKQRQKTIRRQWRQLSQQGTLSFEQLGDGADIKNWTDGFLTLEAEGWKGRAGTALSDQSSSSSFFIQVMQQAHGGGRLRFYRLMLDDQPIAMTMAFDWNGQLSFFKMAYDEQYKRYSPGMLLFAEITKKLDVDDSALMADSCASPSHPLLDAMWQERRAVGDVLIGGRGNIDRMVFAAAHYVIGSQNRLIARLKQIYHRIKARRPR